MREKQGGVALADQVLGEAPDKNVLEPSSRVDPGYDEIGRFDQLICECLFDRRVAGAGFHILKAMGFQKSLGVLKEKPGVLLGKGCGDDGNLRLEWATKDDEVAESSRGAEATVEGDRHFLGVVHAGGRNSQNRSRGAVEKLVESVTAT